MPHQPQPKTIRVDVVPPQPKVPLNNPNIPLNDPNNALYYYGAMLQQQQMMNDYYAAFYSLAMQNASAQRAQEGLGMLQKEFFKKLQSAKDKEDVARITQSYLDQLVHFVKIHPKSREMPDVIRQIVLIYESQDKQVEARAWREKLMKEYPNGSPWLELPSRPVEPELEILNRLLEPEPSVPSPPAPK